MCRKSLKVRFEGRTGMHMGHTCAAKMLRGEGSCFWSSFYRSWSSQCGRKGSREFHSDEGAVGDSSEAGEESQNCQGPCSQSKMGIKC